MPNTARDLLKRLLHLFPVKNIKETFEQTGNATDIIETISGNVARANILGFAFDHYKLTKQNIYLYNLDRAFVRADFGDDFPWTIEKESHVANEYTFFCLPKTTFSVYLSNPMTREDLIFYQPVFIRVSGRKLIVHFTKLEKKISSYFAHDRDAKQLNVINNEEQNLRHLLQHLGDIFTITPTDFNQGMKHLWDIDDVDCYKIQSRNPHSTRIETMDGTLTYKEKYPEEYEAIILTPLGNAHWKYLLEDDYFCEAFSADPSGGTISITKFPKLPNQVTNVISKILANN